MAEHSVIDWGQGTKFQFDQTKPLATHQLSDAQCRPVQQSPEWGRATSFQMLRSNVDSVYAEKAHFKRLSNTERLSIAIRRAVNSLPSQAKAKADELLDPANLAIMAGALAIWIGSQATPVGWVVDIAMAGLGLYALGTEAVVVVRELKAFGMGIIESEKESDLYKAGDHLGKAVAVVGIDLVVALLLKKAIVKVREPVLQGGNGAASKPLLFGKYDPNKVQTRLPPENVPAKSTSKVPVKGPVTSSEGAPAKQYGVAFFGESNLGYYTRENASIGREGKPFFFMPIEDAAVVKNASDAARYTGRAPSAEAAYLEGGDIYGMSFPTNGMKITRPTAADAGGWPHYLEGGNTAVRTGDGPGAGYLVNPTREFVVPGGKSVPEGSVLFKLGPNGEWVPIRNY